MSVIVKPLVTEKLSAQKDKFNRYGFVVSKDANKMEIRNAIQSHYGVSVKEVATMVSPGKRKSRFTKAGVLSGKTSSVKKAIVTIGEGQVIDFFSNI